MRDTSSLHLRLQGYADCFVETDPDLELREISAKGVAGDPTNDLTEVALKYLALAILHGIDQGARKVRIKSKGPVSGSCSLVGKRKLELPRPPTGLAAHMVSMIRCITDLEKDSDKGMFAYGVRNDLLEIDVEVTRDGEEEELTLNLPNTSLKESGGRP